MTLEDFHQFVLFKLMDFEHWEWSRYMAVDSDGRMADFEDYPMLFDNVWQAKNEESKAAWICNQRDLSKQIFIRIPSNLDWKDCVWKL